MTSARASINRTSRNPSRCPPPGVRAQGVTPGSFADRKQQQLVFQLVRQLADAQFRRADPVLSGRLWQEVLALEIDPERITRLLYGGQDPEDRQALAELDVAAAPRRSRWAQLVGSGFRRRVGGGPRSAAPAALQAHQAAG
jgi:hypothetical protein